VHAHRFVAPVCAALVFFPLTSSAKGCIDGAAVAGVAGHVAGHHGVLGAAAGCAAGHHRANAKAKRDATESRAAAATREDYREGATEQRGGEERQRSQ